LSAVLTSLSLFKSATSTKKRFINVLEPETKKMKKTAITITLLTLLGMGGAAHASLTASADGKFVYDNELDITWLADANYAFTNHDQANGTMNWGGANSWASNLNVDCHGAWRLPIVNEMDHLFWEELGGTRGTPISTNHNTNYDLFQNIEGRYWSSEADPNNSSKALSFVFNGFVYNNGNSFSEDKRTGYYAMAVTPGSIVPEPETYAMLMAGLGLLGWKMRKARN
jgi:Protein of unknown function (DUF1566)/PEP-CTERM motif